MTVKIDQKQVVAMVQDLFRMTSQMNGLLIGILVNTGMEVEEAARAMMSGELGEAGASQLAEAVKGLDAVKKGRR